MSECCKERVWSGDAWSRSRACSRKAVKDGYCKQHHPDSVKARRKASDDKWDEQIRNSPQARLRDALATISRLEARIDALMLEYCPDEMTQAQMENWASHQKPSPEEWLPVEDESPLCPKCARHPFQHKGDIYQCKCGHEWEV